MNDLRPVALTPVIFKCFEKLVLRSLLNEVGDSLDPFQFAYKAKRNVEDAVLCFCNTLLKHLDKQRTYARVLFIDFSSAFNTMQPHLLIEKLLLLKINPHLCAWVLDFLTNRPQYVMLNDTASREIVTNTGGP